IQPYTEFRKRLDALRHVASDEGLPLQVEEAYPLEDWLKMAVAAENRCLECYRRRLSAAAARAAADGYGFYSTTLLVSPYQQHEEIARIGAEEGERHGVKFIYRDWRPGWPAAKREIREKGVYLQPYCGCIFSERDRYCRRQAAGR
ncbi:MAG: epoxyqueuosine reductase QueH, partial [bacterium]|nr:epoxyqueuosine reductase QueH [bacterium]